MVTTIYYNGVKLKTLLEDTSLNSNQIHAGGIFVLGQESVSMRPTKFLPIFMGIDEKIIPLFKLDRTI